GLAVGAAFSDRECAGRPSPGDVTRDAQYQSQHKNQEDAALRRHGRNDQNPLPRGNSQNLSRESFQLVNASFVGWAKARLRRAHHLLSSIDLNGGHAALCPPYEATILAPLPAPAG